MRRAYWLGLLVLVVLVAGCAGGEANLNQVTLILDVQGNGRLEPAEGTHEYSQGISVNLKAIPAPDWEFSRWEGEVPEKDKAETTVFLDKDKTVTAVFVQDNREYVVTRVQGTVIGDGEYPVKDLVAVLYRENDRGSFSSAKTVFVEANGIFDFGSLELDIAREHYVGIRDNFSRLSFYVTTTEFLVIGADTPPQYNVGQIEMNVGSCLRLVVKDHQGNRMRDARLNVFAGDNWSGWSTNDQGEMFFGVRSARVTVRVSALDYEQYTEAVFPDVQFVRGEVKTIEVQFATAEDTNSAAFAILERETTDTVEEWTSYSYYGDGQEQQELTPKPGAYEGYFGD